MELFEEEDVGEMYDPFSSGEKFHLSTVCMSVSLSVRQIFRHFFFQNVRPLDCLYFLNLNAAPI